eukprot:scaffold2546_cov118-Isochrysis_galbana.AAC.5
MDGGWGALRYSGEPLNDRPFRLVVPPERCGCARSRVLFETQNINVRDALGAPPPKPCQRFANGICLLNKKGKKCSSLHNLPATWEYNPDGKCVCTVECNLKPHATMKGLCINGKGGASDGPLLYSRSVAP